jgi:hypothetical protein
VPPPSRSQTPAIRRNGDGAEDDDHMPLTEQEMFVKDAFLVFRALCKLTMKPLLMDSCVERPDSFVRPWTDGLTMLLLSLQRQGHQV